MLEVGIHTQGQPRHLFQKDSVDTSGLPDTRQSGVLRQDEQPAPPFGDVEYRKGGRFLGGEENADDQRANGTSNRFGVYQPEIQRPPRRGEIQRNRIGKRSDVK